MRPAFFGIALLGVLAACASKPASTAVMREFSFKTPCAGLRDFFSERSIESRGDPIGPAEHISAFFDDSVFKVVEIKCARLLIPGTNDSEPMPVEMTFFSGGKDIDGRLTRASLKLEERLQENIGGEPTKKFTTGRWESSEWPGGILRVRHYESSPSDTKDLKVVFSQYPSNSPETLDKTLGTFLGILEKEPLVPPLVQAE